MSLQIIARARAARHIWHRFNLFRGGHEIWRRYRWWGFNTTRVFCSCGQEFTERPAGSESVAQLLREIKDMREARRNGIWQ